MSASLHLVIVFFAIDIRREKTLERTIFMLSVEEEFSCDICGDLFCFDCPSFKDEICMEPEEKEDGKDAK